jgi:hypothetical protein
MIDESERQGNGGLKSLTSLVQGETLQLNFVNESFTGFRVPRLFQLKVSNSTTIYELLYMVGQKLKRTYDEIGLVMLGPTRPLTDRLNGKTLAELRVKNAQKF